MKFAGILLALVLFTCTINAMTHKNPSMATLNKLNQLRNNKGSWGSIVLDMAELHLTSGGPLNELIDVINDVLIDVQNKEERAHHEYEQRTILHKSEVTRIQGLIDSANSDIANTTTFINDVLLVQVSELESELVRIAQEIEDGRQFVADATQQREIQHEKYLVVIKETSEAIEVVNEAMQTFDQLKNIDNQGSEFVQIKKTKMVGHLDQLSKKFKTNTDISMLVALTNLVMTSGFTDSESIQKVERLLQQVRTNLLNANAQSEEDEQRQQAQYDADMTRVHSELLQLAQEQQDTQEYLVAAQQSIEDNREFLAQRQADLANFEQDLVDENDSFDRATATYEDLVEQLQSEQAAINEALTFLDNSSIADYIGGRMEQDVMIDQPHGMGITVEDPKNDFLH